MVEDKRITVCSSLKSDRRYGSTLESSGSYHVSAADSTAAPRAPSSWSVTGGSCDGGPRADRRSA